jgi:Fur family ferric uptake transcriptional regulator
MTAQELHEDLARRDVHVGLTTVYRALQSLARDGRADALRNPDGEAIYRACSTSDHHHHLVCTTCGTSVELTADAVEDWAERSASKHGFTDVRHVAEVYGRCRSCS